MPDYDENGDPIDEEDLSYSDIDPDDIPDLEDLGDEVGPRNNMDWVYGNPDAGDSAGKPSGSPDDVVDGVFTEIPGEEPKSRAQRLREWIAKQKRKQFIRKYVDTGAKLEQQRQAQALEEANNRIEAAREAQLNRRLGRLEKAGNILTKVATLGGPIKKKNLAMYDTPALRTLTRPSAPGGGTVANVRSGSAGGMSRLGALKAATAPPETDLRSLTFPNKKLATVNSPTQLSAVREAVKVPKAVRNNNLIASDAKSLQAARAVNNPTDTIKRRAPDLTALKSITMPKLSGLKQETSPKNPRTMPIARRSLPSPKLTGSDQGLVISRSGLQAAEAKISTSRISSLGKSLLPGSTSTPLSSPDNSSPLARASMTPVKFSKPKKLGMHSPQQLQLSGPSNSPADTSASKGADTSYYRRKMGQFRKQIGRI